MADPSQLWPSLGWLGRNHEGCPGYRGLHLLAHLAPLPLLAEELVSPPLAPERSTISMAHWKWAQKKKKKRSGLSGSAAFPVAGCCVYLLACSCLKDQTVTGCLPAPLMVSLQCSPLSHCLRLFPLIWVSVSRSLSRVPASLLHSISPSLPPISGQ